MDRKEWLKTLKAGDKVANKIKVGINREVAYEVLEIKNITAKGNIRLTNGVLLNSDGYYHSYNNWVSKTYNIEPLTTEIISFEYERRKYNQLRNEVWDMCSKFSKMSYTTEQLEQLKEIMSQGKERD